MHSCDEKSAEDHRNFVLCETTAHPNATPTGAARRSLAGYDNALGPGQSNHSAANDKWRQSHHRPSRVLMMSIWLR
jgi:hypothetical protein